MPTRRVFGWMWLLWWAFVCYGSLIPFEYRRLTLEAALTQFAKIPYLDLGLESRIDWLSNLILYVPMTLLGALWLTGGAGLDRSPLRFVGGIALAVAASCATAFGIEFLQLYFPGRTVSLNDLIAEGLGTAIGATVALFAGKRLFALIDRLRSVSRDEAVLAAMVLYGIVYVAVALFPFDFSAASEVYHEKLRSGHVGWWLTPVQASQGILSYLKLVAEALSVTPFGYVFRRQRAAAGLVSIAIFALAIGALIEILQLFLLASSAQGASAAARAFGVLLGAMLAERQASLNAWATPGHRRLAAGLLSVPWFAGVLYLGGWGRSKVDFIGILPRLEEVRWAPFHYHYFTNEAVALSSVLAIGGTYAWVGLAGPLASRHTATWAWPVLAFLIAAAVEASKLVLELRHPDPTNALIAAAAAMLVSSGWNHLRSASPSARVTRHAPEPLAALRGAPAALVPTARAANEAKQPSSTQSASTAEWLQAVVVAVACVVVIRLFPGNVFAEAAAVVAYTATIWRSPSSAFLFVPLFIGVTDVVRFTGNRLWETLDSFMLATLLVAGLHRPQTTGRSWRPLGWAIALMILTAIGLVLDLQSVRITDPDLLFSRIGPINGLLAAKGVLWALTLSWLLRRTLPSPDAALIHLAAGFTLALAGTSVLTILERVAFVPLTDFSSPHRAAGPFSAISTGGAYIECFLAAAAPFAVSCALSARHGLLRAASAVALLLGTYATMTTYSRAGQVMFLACSAATFALCLGSSRPPSGRIAGSDLPNPSGSQRRSNLLWPIAMAALIGVAAAPILLTGFGASRFAQVSPDIDTRLNHWRTVLRLVEGEPLHWLFGRGLGAMPRAAYLELDPKERPALFTRKLDAQNPYVSASPGLSGYLDQTIASGIAGPIAISLRTRAVTAGGSIAVMLCDKDLVQSLQCESKLIEPRADGQWHDVTTVLSLASEQPAKRWLRPHRVVSLMASTAAIEVDDVQARDNQGRDLLVNGGFDSATQGWYYVSDAHLAWHAKNLGLHLIVEQGLVGAALIAAMIWFALLGLAPGLRRRSVVHIALAASLVSFIGIGVIDSLIDTARFAQLFLSLLLTALALRGPNRPPVRKPVSTSAPRV